MSAGSFFGPAVMPRRCLRITRGVRGRCAMTLVEILIVVLILGILAMVVIPKYVGAETEARVSAVQENLHSVQTAIALYHATNGTWPTVIEADWFVGGEVPNNPFDPDNPTGTRYQNIVGKLHPSAKSVNANGSFWYNKANGSFRARVADGGNADVLEQYNLVNGCRLTAINQIK
jgi:prepilin-type N-terminal cleavage/methylation domain-containing protein